MAKASKQLYQLRSDRPLAKGSYVAVNGPWDKFGVVLKSTRSPEGGNGWGEWLNLIRGCDKRVGQQTVYRF